MEKAWKNEFLADFPLFVSLGKGVINDPFSVRIGPLERCNLFVPSPARITLKIGLLSYGSGYVDKQVA